MRRYLYPKNLRAEANMWLWGLKDFAILSITALISVLIFSATKFALPLAGVLCFGFLTIRMEDTTILDFLKYSIRYFLLAQQIFEWR